MRAPSVALVVAACVLLALMLAATVPVSAETVLPTSGAAKIEDKFPDVAAAQTAADESYARSHGYPTRLLSPLRAVVQSTVTDLMTQAAAAYQADESDFDIRYDIALSHKDGLDLFFTGEYDFALGTSPATAENYQQLPSLGVYPLLANAVVFTYSLPTKVAAGRTLALRPTTLCAIFRGNITHWNDAAIQADNPKMILSGANEPIKILLQKGGGGTPMAFVTFCRKKDPEFAALIPAIDPPEWPASLNSQLISGLDPLNSAVADTPYSIAISAQANTVALKLPVGALINDKGQAILPTSTAQLLNLYERGTDSNDDEDAGLDLTAPATSQAWPLLVASYLFIDKTGAVSTCANKKMLLNFLLFFYTSDVVRSIADALSVAALPEVLVSTLGLADQLQTELRCLKQPVYASNADQSILAVSPLASGAMTMFSAFYSSVDPAHTYSVVSTSGSLALRRIVLAEQDFALINTATMVDSDIPLLAEGAVKLIPAYLAAITPIFTLPTALTTFAALASTKDLNLPDLYPLKLDMELTARIFIGEVTSWLDAGLILLNPQLPAWFNASRADPALQIIVGATDATDTMTAARLLFGHLRRTQTAAANPWAFEVPAAVTGPQSNPFLPIIARSATNSSRANFTLIDTENRLSVKCSQVSGSVSYRQMTQFADPQIEFQFVEPLPEGADPATAERTIIPSSVESVKKCGTRYTLPEGSDEWTSDELQDHLAMLERPAVQQSWMLTYETGCYPLQTLISFAVKTVYASAVDADACTTSLHSLEYIHYLQSTTILTAPTEALGLARLASFPLITRMAREILRSATCDDETVLIVLPQYWSVGAGVTGFGQAIGILGIIVVGVSMAIVVVYRHKVVVRSASAPFLLGILFGMGLLIAAAIPWAVQPTRSSCSAFLWLANLGFMLLFCPLFAKTWRVYRIFSGSHLKVVKISNQKLLLMTAAVLLADIVLIAAWQGVAPLVPIEYSRTIGGDQHVFSHCSVDTGGSGIIFVAMVGVEKGLLLLFGAIMAFSTRNVKGTFNESTAISWTIYNTLLTAIIAIVLIVFVKAVENTLVILGLVLLMWIVFSAWGLIFGPKFHLLTQSDEKVIEASRSQITQEKSNGFSFASIAAMTTGQIRQFYIALKLQVNKAERVLELPITTWTDADKQHHHERNDSRLFSNTSTTGSALRQRRLGGGAGLEKPTFSVEDAVAAYRADMQLPAKDRDADRERQLLSSLSGTPSYVPRLHVRVTPSTGVVNRVAPAGTPPSSSFRAGARTADSLRPSSPTGTLSEVRSPAAQEPADHSAVDSTVQLNWSPPLQNSSRSVALGTTVATTPKAGPSSRALAAGVQNNIARAASPPLPVASGADQAAAAPVAPTDVLTVAGTVPQAAAAAGTEDRAAAAKAAAAAAQKS